MNKQNNSVLKASPIRPGGKRGMETKDLSLDFRLIVLVLVSLLLVINSFWPVAPVMGKTTGLGNQDTPPEIPLGPAPVSGFKSGELLVAFKPGISVGAAGVLMREANATLIRQLYGSEVELWRVPEGQELALVETLKGNPSVAFAEPNYRYQAFDTVPNDPKWNNQWGLPGTQMPGAWDITTGSSDVTIAIIDTGIDPNHPDLADKIVAGHDFVDNDANPRDENGHGTHVAGIAAALTNNNKGIAGVDWGARIMPVRVLNEESSGYNSDITEGISWAYEHGADVLNLSLGGSDYSQAMQNAINKAHNNGSLVVAAMGNSRQEGNPTNYPAAYDNVFAVAALGPTSAYSSFSQYGPHCDISAPGGDMKYYQDPKGIYSTMPTYPVYMTTFYNYYQDYDYVNGTSQATPHVAGLAALIWSVDPGLTPDEVQALIETSADDLGAPGWDEDYGHGRINAYAALESYGVPDAPVLSPIDNPDQDGDYLVDWNDVPNATGFTLEEDDNASFTSPTEVFSGTVSEYQVMGHQAGTWYYRVRATSVGGDSPWSNPQSVTVMLGAPMLLPISNPDGDGDYLVDWEVVTGTLSYSLQEAGDWSFTFPNTVYTGTESQFGVSGMEGGRWYYRVRASDASGEGPWSNIESVVVKPSAPVLAPIVNPGDTDAYQLNWVAGVGATGNTLEEDDDPSFGSPSVRYMGEALDYTVTGQPGGTWYYRVQSYNAAGDGPWSTTVQSTTVTTPALNAPLLTPIDNDDQISDYQVGWTAVTSATVYTLEQSSDPYFVAPIVVYSGTMTRTTVTEQPAGEWWYRVRAAGPPGRSPWSGPQSTKVGTMIFLPLVLRDNRPVLGFTSQFNGTAEGWVAHTGGWQVDDQFYWTEGLSRTNATASYTTEYSDFDFQAKLLRVGCALCANFLMVRGTPEPLDSSGHWDSSYRFQYTNQGKYSVFKQVAGGGQIPLQDWTSDPAILAGEAWNTLRVLADGDQLSFYINGKLVWSGTDADLSAGRIGVGMYLGSFVFDDVFKVDWATLTPLDSTALAVEY
jgi:thermitase